VLIVLGSSPVTAPAPTTIGEDPHRGVSCVQDSGVCAIAVQIWRGVLGLEGARPVDVGIEQRVEVDGATEGVLRPAAGAGNVAAVECRGVVVLHGQLIVGVPIVVDRTDLLDRVLQLKKLLEDRNDLRRQVLMHDQIAAVGLSVEADVVDLDSAQLPWLNRAAGMPAGAEIGRADGLNRGWW